MSDNPSTNSWKSSTIYGYGSPSYLVGVIAASIINNYYFAQSIIFFGAFVKAFYASGNVFLFVVAGTIKETIG